MIKSFSDRDTEDLWNDHRVPRFQEIDRIARRKLHILNAATNLPSLAVPPGNHLEALQHDRIGQHSIRINNKWRICFSWVDGHPHNVEICDYH